jgi:hypothetical protein
MSFLDRLKNRNAALQPVTAVEMVSGVFWWGGLVAQIAIVAHLWRFYVTKSLVVSPEGALLSQQPDHFWFYISMLWLSGCIATYGLIIKPPRRRGDILAAGLTGAMTMGFAGMAVVYFLFVLPAVAYSDYMSRPLYEMIRTAQWSKAVAIADGSWTARSGQPVPSGGVSGLFDGIQLKAEKTGDKVRVTFTLPGVGARARPLDFTQGAVVLPDHTDCFSDWAGLNWYRLSVQGFVNAPSSGKMLTSVTVDGKPWTDPLPPCGKTVVLAVPAWKGNAT